MTAGIGRYKAFFDGMVTAIFAHAGAAVVLVTVDKIFYILGHILVAVAVHIATGGRGQ